MGQRALSPRLCLQEPGELRKGLEQGKGRSLWLCVEIGWERMGLRQETMKEVEGAQEGEKVQGQWRGKRGCFEKC